MTPDEREEMNRLCLLIQEERDPARFTSLVEQLNLLLERSEHKLASKKTPAS